mmetsp:Transcript_533/g.1339  ORF Transcript_533/g.1339 Transcript_533/m.1339 type:complete len:85 (+) Transcript_533:78-332(+)
MQCVSSQKNKAMVSMNAVAYPIGSVTSVAPVAFELPRKSSRGRPSCTLSHRIASRDKSSYCDRTTSFPLSSQNHRNGKRSSFKH